MVTRTKHACIICEYLLQNNFIDNYYYEKICGSICRELNFDLDFNNNLSKYLINYCIKLKLKNLALDMGEVNLSQLWILELGALIQPNYLLALQFIIDHQTHTFPFAKIEMFFDRHFYFTIEPLLFQFTNEDGYIFSVEYHLSQLLNIVKTLVPFIDYPKKIYVTFAPPAEPNYYKEYFNCEIIYNSNENRISFGVSRSKLTEKLDPISFSIIEEKILHFLELSKAIQKTDSELKNKINFIFNQSGNDLPNEETLANQLNMHPRTLRRKLKAEGETFRNLVTEYKIKKAITLLTMTKLNFKQVAYQLGFKSSTSFSKSFKSWTGYSPQKYRNSNY
ncbi:helix-turn-helix domain-containing protein [Acinetobacter calcoaceticus]|uniref:helix-turn-helix transcriptional regulator n=1 Tax=Acinetobacter calcoaceticus TaxID=471 RepID=UPI00190061BC|nr:helix-turn-helix domain-containing protein [Acinetobacter calcoaceticus]MBJ9720705.1 helix-turn-helix domain-containing protein [Acinetobacter calcoaceticus]